MIKHNPKNIGEIYENIPTWDNGTWKLTSFKSRKQFAKELESNYFKEPGTYELDKNVKLFNSEAITFNKKGYYCDFLENSIDYIDYWDDQKLKCRKGVFIWSKDKKWYLPREYYFWINFLPIIDKVKKSIEFPEIWDSQIYLSIYELLAELNFKHAVVLKKRQFGSSFYHVAKLINYLWFEKAPVLKMGASLEGYLTGVNGSWKFAQMYRTFLNKETAWTREMNPATTGEWVQKQEVNENGRKYDVGLMGTLQSISFQQSDTAGVGGLTSIFFYEEAGIAPRMDKTVEFLLPAMEAGDITTGIFIAAGSVGDLDQCKPLKKYIYKPYKNNFQSVKNQYVNEKGTVLETGLFVPEQWSMPPYIDKYGNSLVEQALERLKELYDQWERDLDTDVCQIRKSQRPINMEVAFSTRGDSRFPLALVNSHQLDLDDGQYPRELIELERDKEGKIIAKTSIKPPIREFPVDKKMVDKSSCLIVYERPDENPEWHTYYASIDPVSEGKTTASDSLCSIFVYKNPIEVTKYENGKMSTYVEGDKVVASWAGRYDDINKTHELLEMIIEWYNAWTLVEANVYLFIVHMIHQKKQKYLVPKSEMVFLKEHGYNKGTFQEYGWKNTGTLFVNNLLTYLIEFCKEKIHIETNEEGDAVKVIYGITRIPDIMALEEMKQYEYGLNVDRLISLSALVAFVKLQSANKGYKKRIESEDPEYLQSSDKLYKLSNRSAFKHMGKIRNKNIAKVKRNPFKNIR